MKYVFSKLKKYALQSTVICRFMLINISVLFKIRYQIIIS